MKQKKKYVTSQIVHSFSSLECITNQPEEFEVIPETFPVHIISLLVQAAKPSACDSDWISLLELQRKGTRD
jgi:hypothetical protein